MVRLLRDEQKVTPKMFEHIVANMGLDAANVERLRKGLVRPTRARQTLGYVKLEEDQLKVIGDWYHYAILALLDTEDFSNDPAWLAARLGLSKAEASLALDRLERLKIIEQTSQGEWIQLQGPHLSTLDTTVTSQALKQLQRQILELSQQALQVVPIEKRSHSTLTVSFQSDQIIYVKEQINKLRRTLHQRIRKCSKKPDTVYQFAISFFPLTK